MLELRPGQQGLELHCPVDDFLLGVTWLQSHLTSTLGEIEGRARFESMTLIEAAALWATQMPTVGTA